MTDIETLLPDILRSFPNGKDAGEIKEAIIDTAIDICRRTRCLSELFHIDRQEGVLEYPLPDDINVLEVIPVGGTTVRIEGDSLWVVGGSCHDQAVAVLVLAPLPTDCQIDDRFFTQWRDVLMDGTMARLMKTSFRMDYSKAFKTDYLNGINQIIFSIVAKDRHGNMKVRVR